MKLGVKNLLPLIFLGAEMGNVADSIGHAKGAARYVHLMDLFDEVMALGKVDFHEAKKELSELDDADKEEIKNAFKAKFEVEDHKVELAIEEGLTIIADTYSLIERSIALAKGLKKNA